MKIGLTAIKGNIQKNLALELSRDSLFDLSSGLVREGYDEVGVDIGTFLGINKTNTFITDNISELFEKSDVVVDFSTPELTLKTAETASVTGKTLISGTKYLNDEELDKLKKYAEHCKIIYSNNMSITFNLLLNLIELSSSILREDYNVNIVDFENIITKTNSDMSYAIAKSVSKGRGWEFGEVYKKMNGNNEGNNEKQINFASLRGIDKFGEYSVLFNGIGEELKIQQNITSIASIIKGVKRAIIWSDGKPNGFYTMQDVLKI